MPSTFGEDSLPSTSAASAPRRTPSVFGEDVAQEDLSADWLDVLKAAAPKAGLSLAQGVGGITRSLGDVLNVRSVSDWGAELARNAAGATEMIDPANQSFTQRAVGGGLESAMMMLPAMAGGAATVAARGIGLAAGQQFGESYSDLRDKGFSGGSAGLHASIRALAEGLGEKVSIGVLSETGRPILNQLFAFMKRDLPGEQLTTAIQSLDQLLSDRPNMTIGEYLDAAALTAATTAVAGPGQVAAIRAAQGALSLGMPNQGGGEVPSAEPAPVAPAPVGEPTATPIPLPAVAPAPTGESVTAEAPKPDTITTSPEPAAPPAPTTETLPEPSTPPKEPTLVAEPATPEPQILPEVAPAPVVQAPPTPPQVAPDSFVHPAPVQIAAGVIDPRVYNEFPGQKLGQVIDLGKGFFQHIAPNEDSFIGLASEVVQHMVQHYNAPDLSKNPGVYERLVDAHILHSVMNSPDTILDLSDEVKARFGGQLAEIANLARERNQEAFGRDNRAAGSMVLPELFGNADSMIRMGDWAGSFVDSRRKVRNGSSAAQVRALPAGTYLSGNQAPTDAMTLRTVRILDGMRQRFLGDTRLLVRVVAQQYPDGRPNKELNGRAFALGPGLVGIEINTNAVGAAEILRTMLHEFGHTIIYTQLGNATPEVKAKLLLSYLQYTRGFSKNTPIREYMLEHHGDPRTDARVTIEDVRRQRPSTLDYAMSASEYLADQASQQLAGRLDTTDPGVAAWYQALTEKLRQVFDFLRRDGGAPKEFKRNETFADWLDSLGGKDKVTLTEWGKEAAKRPPRKKIEPKAAPTVSAPDPGVQARLIKQRKQLLDLLAKAGATEEQLDAIDGDGTVAGFNFEAAFELADALGIPPSDYMMRVDSARIDDTTNLREGLFNMNISLNDSDLREELGKSAHALKSFNWGLQKTITAVQLRKRFGAAVPGVKAFVDSLERMWAYRSNWKSIADDRLTEMKELKPAERNAVFAILLEEDKIGKFLSVPTATPTGRTFILPAEVAQRYKLTERGVRLYTRLRQDFDAALDEIELNTELELTRQYGQSEGGAKRIAALKEEFARMKAQPYVPHSRFGSHTVVVRDAKGKVVEFYQDETEREAIAQEMTSRQSIVGKEGWTVSRGKISDEVRSMMGMPPQMLQAMKSQLHMSDEQIATFEELIKDMSSGASFVRRFKKRKGTAGWESDVDSFPRAYADYFSRFANHASRIRFNPELNDGINSVSRQAREFSKAGENTVTLDELANWLRHLQDYVNNPGEEYANLRAAATVWHLGFMPKSALVNGLGVPMVTLPYLSSRFGWTRAFAQISQAYKDVTRMFLRPQALTEDERLMLEDLRKKGFIDASFASELAGIREGGRLSDMTALSKLGSVGFAGKQYAMWMFHRIEVANRTVTALAAYRLNRDLQRVTPGEYDATAGSAAATAIQDTQNENAQWNRAEFMRHRKAVLTMFMSYQQNLIYQMFGGDASWMRMLAIQMAMAGLMGLPFAKDASDLIKWFGREVFGTDMNLDRAIRQWLKNTSVDADWLLRGASHNVFGMDLQGSLSTGRVIPGIEALTSEGKFPDRVANAVGDVGGAGFSIIMDVLKAASSNDPNTLRRVQQALPPFFRSLSEGANALTSGRINDPQGDKLANVTPLEAMARMAGFQLTDVSTERQKRIAQRDTAQFWLNRREYVMATWAMAIKSGDAKWRAKAQDALTEYNKEAPDYNLRITAAQLKESLRRKAMGSVRKEFDLGPSNTVSGSYKDTAELYK